MGGGEDQGEIDCRGWGGAGGVEVGGGGGASERGGGGGGEHHAHSVATSDIHNTDTYSLSTSNNISIIILLTSP